MKKTFVVLVATLAALASILSPSPAQAATSWEYSHRSHAIDGGLKVNMNWRWATTYSTSDPAGTVKLRQLSVYISGDKTTLADNGGTFRFTMRGPDGYADCNLGPFSLNDPDYFIELDNPVQASCQTPVMGSKSGLELRYTLRDQTALGTVTLDNDGRPYEINSLLVVN